MKKSWAIYTSVALLFVMGIGILWAYWKDKKDEINYEKLKTDKKKIYVNLYL